MRDLTGISFLMVR